MNVINAQPSARTQELARRLRDDDRSSRIGLPVKNVLDELFVGDNITHYQQVASHLLDAMTAKSWTPSAMDGAALHISSTLSARLPSLDDAMEWPQVYLFADS